MSSLGSGTGSQYSTPTQSQYATPVSAPKHEGHFSQNMPPNQLQPTWNGYVADTLDALVLFQGAIDGVLRKVVRRPHDRERAEVIRSGAVFIYEESASGIKRWTDGVPWSPSRILGNFLIYRELEKPFPPGEKKRATKKPKSPRPGEPYPQTRPGEPYPPRDVRNFDNGMGASSSSATGGSIPGTPSPLMPSTQTQMTPTRSVDSSISTDRDSERSLVGSLTDSYAFKDRGLVKKTLSINHDGGHLHLVSYYIPEDVKGELLPVRQDDQRVSHIQVRPELIQQQNFRSPLDSSDDGNPPVGLGPAGPGQAGPGPASAASSYRPPLPSGQYVGSASSSSSFMPNQQYHLPPQQMGHSGSSYYGNMGAAPQSAHHLPGSYSYGQSYPDFYKPMAGTAQSAQHPHQHPQYQGMGGPAPHVHMQPDQSSYMQQSSYQMQDSRGHGSESYSENPHMKNEWPDSHR